MTHSYKLVSVSSYYRSPVKLIRNTDDVHFLRGVEGPEKGVKAVCLCTLCAC